MVRWTLYDLSKVQSMVKKYIVKSYNWPHISD